MRTNRVLALLSGAAAIAVTISLAPDTQAACYWGSYGWVCDQPVPQQIANTPLPSVPPGANWGTDRYTPQGYNYNNFDQIPNDYPGPALTTPNGRGGGGGRE